MTYYFTYKIEELELKIPKEEFPLKSNNVVGWEFPEFKFPEDECSYEWKQFKKENGFQILSLKKFGGGGCDEEPLWELEELCKKYKGTLKMVSHGEDDDTDYTRIINGIKKKAKLVFED